MFELTTDQRRRLPGYVLMYVDRLERKLADVEHLLEEKQDVDTNVWRRVMHPHGDLPIERDSEIRFDLFDGDHDDVFRRAQYIEVRHSNQDPSELTISGGRPMVIYPWSAYMIHLRIPKR